MQAENLDLILPGVLSLIYSKGRGEKLLWISARLLLKLALQCQPWLALAHGHFHALYLDPAGTVWNPEISLSTKHVILRSVELRLASGQWKLKSTPWKQRMAINIHTLSLNTLKWGFESCRSCVWFMETVPVSDSLKKSEPQSELSVVWFFCLLLLSFYWSIWALQIFTFPESNVDFRSAENVP